MSQPPYKILHELLTRHCQCTSSSWTWLRTLEPPFNLSTLCNSVCLRQSQTVSFMGTTKLLEGHATHDDNDW